MNLTEAWVNLTEAWVVSLTEAWVRACSHEPGQLTDPGVNFASVHGLTPVTVHMSFSLPRGNFERQVNPLYNTG